MGIVATGEALLAWLARRCPKPRTWLFRTNASTMSCKKSFCEDVLAINRSDTDEADEADNGNGLRS